MKLSPSRARARTGVLAAIGSACALLAQNPYVVCPRNYQLEFENEYVRVSRVRHLPGDKLPVHDHPSLRTVYIYLTDGGAIRFCHITPKFTIEGPPVKAGGVRFNAHPQPEIHEVEYLGDAPAEYLRFELRTAHGPPHRDTRLAPEHVEPWEDEQVRISRRMAAGPAQLPSVVVSLRDRRFVFASPGDTVQGIDMQSPLVLIELKTRPSSP